jgi:hypothetical protein
MSDNPAVASQTGVSDRNWLLSLLRAAGQVSLVVEALLILSDIGNSTFPAQSHPLCTIALSCSVAPFQLANLLDLLYPQILTGTRPNRNRVSVDAPSWPHHHSS